MMETNRETAEPARSAPDSRNECRDCGACADACALIRGKGPPAKIFARPDVGALAYECTLCGRCDAVCPFDVEPSLRFREIRRDCHAGGDHPRGAWRGLLLFERLGRMRPFRAHLIPEGAKSVFFPGCNLPGIRPEAAMRLWAALREREPGTGVVFDCCSILSRNVGDQSRFRHQTDELVERLRARGVERIVTACSSCMSALRSARVPFELVSAYRLLAQTTAVGEEAKLGPVQLHEPCSSHRDPEYLASVRSLAKRSGLTLVDPSAAEKGPLCCSDPHWKNRAAPEQTLMLTPCAGCFQTLSKSTPSAHLLDIWFGTGTPERAPGLVRQFLTRFRLIRRARALLSRAPDAEVS